MLDDDRPINPNKQYIEQKNAEMLLVKQPYKYLKKDQKKDLLPCQKHQIVKSTQKCNFKSKAQIYQQIKRKNLQKFGPKKDKILSEKKEQKKIKIKNMTVNYRHKPKIELQEYKLKQQSSEKQKCRAQNQDINEPKQKYEKLLQILRDQQQNLNIKKSQFQKYEQSLKFKKQIENEETIPFIKTIREQILNKTLKNKIQRHIEKKYNKNSNQSQKQVNKKVICQNKQISKNLISSQIVQFIDKANAEKQKIKEKLFQQNKTIQSNQVIIKMYSVYNFNEIPKFDVQNTKQFINLQTIQPKNNTYYHKAIAIFQNGLRFQNKQQIFPSKYDKKTFTQTDIIQGFPSQFRQIQKKKINDKEQKVVVKKVKMEGQKRVVKYDNNWIQVWHPGHQRLIAALNNQYKIVWLRNGDIKQQWKSKSICSYYCKAKNLVKISYKNFEPIIYYIDLNQLQQTNPEKTQKQVFYRDGRIQIVNIN